MKIFYVLVCRVCDGDLPEKWLPIPFGSVESRGRWAAEHTRATGHDKWWVFDQPDPVEVS